MDMNEEVKEKPGKKRNHEKERLVIKVRKTKWRDSMVRELLQAV